MRRQRPPYCPEAMIPLLAGPAIMLVFTDDLLVHFKTERHFSTVNHCTALLHYWEIIDAQKLLQSSVQRLTFKVGAGDASMAPSATTTTHRSGSREGRHLEMACVSK